MCISTAFGYNQILKQYYKQYKILKQQYVEIVDSNKWKIPQWPVLDFWESWDGAGNSREFHRRSLGPVKPLWVWTVDDSTTADTSVAGEHWNSVGTRTSIALAGGCIQKQTHY